MKAWRELSPLGHCAVITAAIWIGGWIVGLLVYCFATPPEADPLYDYKHSKSYEYGVQRFAGGAGVFANQLTDTIASLFRGPTLGITIAVITATVALVYFLVTYRKLRRQRPRSISASSAR